MDDEEPEILTPPEEDECSQYDFGSTIESSEVEKKVSEAVKQVLNNDLPWEPDQLNSLLQSLDETIHEKLKALNKYYKFLIYLAVGPNIGAGMDMSVVAFWEQEYDGYVRTSWNNANIHIWIIVFWIRN
ncbi:dynein light chain Tctex-type protein 2B-like [Rhodnius prolixus]